MKKVLLLLVICLFPLVGFSQEYKENKKWRYSNYQIDDSPQFVLKTNVLYWLTTTINMGLELGITPNFTVDVSANYNPWDFGDNKKIKHFLIQPEVRYWLDERFSGHFFGLHGHYARYNMGGIDLVIVDMSKYRYDGHLFGGGLTYGYQWAINNKWRLEALVGLGYARLNYEKSYCKECGDQVDDIKRNYWGPTKVGVNFIYLLK